MRFLEILYKHRIIYVVVYFLILLNFVGGFVSDIAILIMSLLVFIYMLLSPKWDIYLIFLFLIPTLIFTSYSDSDFSGNIPFLFKYFKNVWIIGPFALSSAFAMALAIPIRVILDFGKSENKSLILIWLINLILAIIGLIIAIINKAENPSGITVGFRISLALGAILIIKKARDKNSYLESLDKIILVSLLLLLFGMVRAHWYFIVFGFIPYVIDRIKPRIMLLIPLFFLIYVLFNLKSNTITMLGILVTSLIFYFGIRSEKSMWNTLKRRYFIFLILVFPIIITLLVIGINRSESYDITNLKGYVEFKLLGDRKPIWDASWKEIWSSSFFVKPAGSHLRVYFDYIRTWQDWTAGSHNVFLEIGRQINAFSMITLTFIIFYIIYKAAINLQTKADYTIFYCFLSVYLVLGLTGQSLIYDGIGALFWLLFGQMYQLSLSPEAKNGKVISAPQESNS